MDNLVIKIFIEMYEMSQTNEIQGQIKEHKLDFLDGKKSLHISEALTIIISFHISKCKDFKAFYKSVFLEKNSDWSYAFPLVPSYERLIEIKNNIKSILEIAMNKFFENNIPDGEDFKAFADSFSIETVKMARRHSVKTLKKISKLGHTSMGAFFGAKLHLVALPNGKLISAAITPGNVADNNHDLLRNLTSPVKGTLYGDKGYNVKKNLKDELKENGVDIIAKPRSNMKNKSQLKKEDAEMLKKRPVIESIGNILKNFFSLKYQFHRCLDAFYCHIFSLLIAYSLRDEKPSCA